MEAQYRYNQGSPSLVELRAVEYDGGYYELDIDGPTDSLAFEAEEFTSVVRNDSMCFAHLILFHHDGTHHDFAVDSSQRKALDDIVAKVFDQ